MGDGVARDYRGVCVVITDAGAVLDRSTRGNRGG